MRHPDIDLMMVMERRRDELAEADLSRRFNAALRESAPSSYPTVLRPSLRVLILALARSLSFLGGYLLTWSCRLQVRYQAVENQPSPCG